MEADSPTRSYDNQEEPPRGAGKEDYGKRSSDLDLNQAATKADDDDGEDYQSTGEHWQQTGKFDADQVAQEQRSPVAEQLSRSPSPKRSPPLTVKRSPSPTNKLSVSPEPREQFHPPSRKSPSSGRSVSPRSTRRSSPSPRRRQSPGRRRSLSRSPDGGSGRAAGADEGRKPYDRHGPSSRSPVERSARAVSPRGRERSGRSRSRSPARDSSRRERYRRSRSRSPSARDSYRRSRYSPHRRASPPRYRSRRDRSPRRRPWSPPPNRITGVGKPGNNLFIAGFSFVTTERDLEKKFSRYGRVTDVRIVRDKRSGDSRGFGFLSLERDEDADAAIRALDQTEWNGRIVLVEKAKPPTRY